jgi:uncharacterized membrane protein
MKTLFAYITVIAISKVVLTIGIFVGSFLSKLFFLLIHKVFKLQYLSLIEGILSGIGGSLLAFCFANLIFNFLVGQNSFGALGFLSCLIAITHPIVNRYAQYKKSKASEQKLDTSLLNSLWISRSYNPRCATARSKGILVGFVLGILTSGYSLLFI